MYCIYKETHPATGIEHSVYCDLYGTKERNLVVAGANQLNVYRLNSSVEQKSADGSIDPKPKKKLECLGTYSVFGIIASMQSFRLPGSNRDGLVLSFKDAKLSLLEYDPGTHDLKTSSLHYFEEETLKGGRVVQLNYPLVRVDPDNRCSVMLVYGQYISVLPFRRDAATDETEGKTGGPAPVLSSYQIDVTNLDEKITNIIDIQFLHGYYEPTLFILYEPHRTWAGRVAVRQDTCCIVAISLNMQEKVHPVIWSLTNLPYDCIRAIPVPKPTGGVLVMGTNTLLYLNQSFPPYGVSLNSLSESFSAFPLKKQDDVIIALDNAQAAFITSDSLVFSLKTGELYVLSLMVDGMRSVRGFNFDKAASSVLTTCMCMCDDGYLFLGSRLGNSLLLKYTTKDDKEESKGDPKPVEQPPSKKKRLDTMGDWMASDVTALDETDDLEVYGKEKQTGIQITTYTFEVCDSILNIAPCGKVVMGEPAFLSEEFGHSTEPDIELVSTSGHGKNGALTVLQRHIRPQVVTTFNAEDLPNCYDLWTVTGADSKNSDQHHAFLVLSKEDSSMVLETGQEIMELDHSGFCTQSPTVFAGNIGDGKFILQVSPMGVRLLEGAKQLQHIPIDVGSSITQCSVADPYVFIMTEQGQMMMLVLKIEGHNPRLTLLKPSLAQKPIKISTFCAYKDVSGIFTTEVKKETHSETDVKSQGSHEASIFSLDKSISVDDEDELLYGDHDISVFDSDIKPEKQKTSPAPAEVQEKDIKASYWLAVARENGILEIFSIPDFKLVFAVKSFPMGMKVLVDSGQSVEKGAAPESKQVEISEVKEILIVGLGNKQRRPYLFARVNEELFIYEAFSYQQSTSKDDKHLKLRFKKNNHGLILRQRKVRTVKKPEEGKKNLHREYLKLFRYFSDISGYAGVFICGPYPHWVFMTSRGKMRIHPMSIDGSVLSFSPFHNVNCPRGFLYFNKQGELRIAVLPTHLTYDSAWPIRKVPLRCTPHFVTYHMESKTYMVATSLAEPSNKHVRIVSDEKEVEEVEKDERFVLPLLKRFSIQLFSPVSWEAIPNTKIEMDEWEHVTCLSTVQLKSQETISGMKGYVCYGTNYSYGEDITSRGRIFVTDIIEVVPEPGQPLTKNKIKVLYEDEQKGPVTAVCSVNGFLVTAIGQKIYIWSMKDNELSGVAFIDTHVYIHTLASLKNLILAADIMKSVSLLRYQPDVRVLSVVSRDVKPLDVYSTEFLVDNTNLSFVVSDKNKNISIFAHQPESHESAGGTRLLRRGDINIGSHVNTFFRVKCKLFDPSSELPLPPVYENRQVTYFASLDGGMGFLLPLTEKTYRRLQMLQNILNTHVPHLAGLNPKAFRSAKNDFKQLVNANKNILDGDLIWKYLNLSTNDRVELARKIGTSTDMVMDDLTEIDRVVSHF